MSAGAVEAGTVRSAAAIGAAGMAIVGSTYGMARYGYGLLLPDLRAAFGLSSGALGAIAAGSYLAYLVTTALAGALAARVAPRTLVLLAGVLATAGMLVAAAATTPVTLAAGVVLAGSGAGLTLPPMSDVVARVVAPRRRARTLAAISAGTGAGIVVAAPIAVLAGASWRTAWTAFAAATVLATLAAVALVPGDRAATAGAAAAAPRLRPAWFVCPRSGPLLVGALLVALAASVWWTFAVDYAADAGGLDRATSRGLQVLVGVASLVGAVAGDLVRRSGGRRVFLVACVAYAAAFALLALAPQAVVLAGLAGLLFGGTYNVLVSVSLLWAARVFADRPSAGVAAVLWMSGTGLLLGPLLAGPAADAVGLRAVLLAAAALALAVVALAPRESLTS